VNIKVSCPDCGSSSCKSLLAAYMGGTRDTQRKYSGIGGTARGSVGGYVGSSSGVSRSRLAQSCAPPTQPVNKAGSYVFAVMIVLPLCGAWAFSDSGASASAGFWTGVVVGALLGVWAYFGASKDYRAKLQLHKAAVATYEHSWVCFKCAHVWEDGK
jgi:hypothetical protein